MRRGVALVTGSASGFGRHACASLVARGYRVYASMRDPSRGEAVLADVAARGFSPEDVELVALDVDDPDAVADLADRIHARHGALDVLVNNAGVAAAGFAEEFDEAELRRLLDTNFLAVVRLTQRFAPSMRERRSGRIVNVSSIGGRIATPGHAGYHASKFALEGWSEALHHELRPFHVFVSLIEPGLFPTGIFAANYRKIGPGVAGRGPYARLAAKLDEASARASRRLAWADPRDVGELVAKVAIAEAPRLRYPIGVDAWASTLLGPGLVGRAWEQAMLAWFRD